MPWPSWAKESRSGDETNLLDALSIGGAVIYLRIGPHHLRYREPMATRQPPLSRAEEAALPCLPTTMQRLEIESSITFPAVHIDIRRMTWDSVHEAELRTNAHYFDYALAPRGTPGFFDKSRNRYCPVGRIIFLPKDGVFSVRSTRGDFYNLCLSVHDVGTLREITQERLDDFSTPCFDVRGQQIAQGLARMAAEIRNPGFAHEALLESLALTLLIDFSRYAREICDGKGEKLPKWRLDRIRDLVEGANNYAIPISDIARECGLSPRHLMRTFRATTGTTLHDYIGEARLDFAKTALRAGAMVKQVALDCGFKTSAAFTASFRRSTGLTPRAFRVHEQAYILRS